MNIKLVNVKYRGSNSDREYAYYYQGEEDLKKGDTVVVPLKHGEKHAIVSSSYPIKELIRVGE